MNGKPRANADSRVRRERAGRRLFNSEKLAMTDFGQTNRVQAKGAFKVLEQPIDRHAPAIVVGEILILSEVVILSVHPVTHQRLSDKPLPRTRHGRAKYET